MDRGAWRATAHGVTESDLLRDLAHMHAVMSFTSSDSSGNFHMSSTVVGAVHKLTF